MDYAEILRSFGLFGESAVTEIKSGHINKTFCVSCKNGEKYILQSLNNNVFHRPEKIMANVREIEAAFERSDPYGVGVPHYLFADDRNYIEIGGELWRLCRYVASADCPTEQKHFLMGLSFGVFIRTVGECRLAPAVDNFHSYGRYFSSLKKIGEGKIIPDIMERLGRLQETLASVFTAKLTKRNVHNDAKADNVIFGEKCTVIDLDTAAEGFAAFDYGDMIRSACKTPDIKAITDITRGFAQGLDGILGREEVDSLYYGILWAVGELAVRYLTDSISEKKYFSGKSSSDCLERAEELLAQLDVFCKLKDEVTEIINREFAEEKN